MKLLVVLTLLFPFSTFAKSTVKDFNKALMEKVESDAKDETNDHFRKSAPGRGPASVPTAEPEFYGNEKIEKNLRQIGTQKW